MAANGRGKRAKPDGLLPSSAGKDPIGGAIGRAELLTQEEQTLPERVRQADLLATQPEVGATTAAGVPASATGGGEVVLTLWGDVWRRLRKNRLAIIGLGIIGLLVLTAIFAPLIATHPPDGVNLDLASACRGPCGPTLKHWFGTDQLGQDIFSRVVYGARISVVIGVGAVGFALVVGLTLGSIAGYFGGMADGFIMRVCDVFFAFPYVLAAIVLIIALEDKPRLLVIALAIGVFGWATIARLLRASILSAKETEYIEAARALGAGHFRIITRHILPNSLAPVIVYSTITIGTAILAEAALSFLGIGIQPPTAAWGLMVAQGKEFLTTRPYMIVFPGLAIVFTVLGFVFVGDGLRDSMDPRLR